MSPWVRLVFLALGAAVLLLITASTDLGELQTAVSAADRGRLLGAVALVVINVWIKAVRWRFMTAQLTERPLSLRQAGIAVLAGVAAGSLTPARGMDLAKPLLLARSRGVPMSVSTAAVIVERLLDGAGLIVLCGVSLVLLPAGRAAVFGPVFAVIGLVVAAMGVALIIPARMVGPMTRVISALPLSERVRTRAVGLLDAFVHGMLVWRRPAQLWVAAALSVAAAAVEALRLVSVLAAMHAPLSLAQAMFAFSLGNVIAVLTFIPGGVGVTELSVAGVIRLIAPGVAATALTAAVLVDRFLSYYVIVVLGGLVLLLSGAARREPPGNAGTE